MDFFVNEVHIIEDDIVINKCNKIQCGDVYDTTHRYAESFVKIMKSFTAQNYRSKKFFPLK